MAHEAAKATGVTQEGLLHILENPEAGALADVHAEGSGEGSHAARGRRFERVKAGHVRHGEHVGAADEHDVVIAVVDEALGQAEGNGGGGTGGGDNPRFATELQGAGHSFAEAIELGLQVHLFVDRARAAAVFPGVLRLCGAKAAVAGAQHHGDVAPEAVAAGLNSRVAQGPPGRGDGMAQIAVFVFGHLRLAQPLGQMAVFDFGPEIAAEMAGVESLDGRQSVASGAKRLRDSLRGVADGTGNANAGDGGLPADALAPQLFAQNLHAALPRRRFEEPSPTLLPQARCWRRERILSR